MITLLLDENISPESVEAVNEALARFLSSSSPDDYALRHSLAVVSETSYRVCRGQRGQF